MTLFSLISTKILPSLIISKLGFFIGYKITKNPCLVDVGYVFNHLLAGSIYAYYTGALFTPHGYLYLGLLSIWCLRLGGFLYYNRIHN